MYVSTYIERSYYILYSTLPMIFLRIIFHLEQLSSAELTCRFAVSNHTLVQ